MSQRKLARSGVVTVETAVILSGVFMVIFSLLVGGLGAFRYQEIAHAARETARYASVHGGQWAKANPGTTVDVAALSTYAASKVVAIDTTQWTVSVTMTCFASGATSGNSTPPAPTTVNWDTVASNGNHSPYSSWTNTTTNTATTADNLVTVTITYPWYPEFLLGGPINLTSTAVMAMSY